MQIFRLCLLARKVTKFLMPFFKLQVGFLLDFALPSSVMTYNPSEISSWKCILWTKRAHQCTIFQNFERCNESSPNSSCHFWNHKVRIYSNSASLFSFMKDNSSVFFQLKPYILRTKIAQWSKTLELLSGWVKIYKIPHVTFESTSHFLFKICS